MTFRSKARRTGLHAAAAALAVTAMAIAATGARSQQFTLDQLVRMGGDVAAHEFPPVLGGGEIRARFYQKRSFTIADGSRHTMFLFRASNCWLRERTATARAAIDCRGNTGPGVFIPVLFVTPAPRPRPGMLPAPDLILRSRHTSSFADYAPAELLDRVRPHGDAIALWIGLNDPKSDSLALTAPAAPAALVVCVPLSSAECENGASVQLTNLDDTPPDPAGRAPAVPAPEVPAPAAPAPAAAPTVPAPAARAPPAPGTPASNPPPPATTVEAPAAPPAPPRPPQAAPPQLHYIVIPAASAALPGWTRDRMAKRLLALVDARQGEFLVTTRDRGEVHSSLQPALTQSGDAVVAWSGDRPEGPAELVFRGVEGIELVPRTQSAAPQAAPVAQVNTRIGSGDVVSFAEFRIAAPLFYDQWQARIEAVTKVYGREQPASADDLCQFTLLIPRIGLISLLAGPVSVGLDRTADQGGRRILQSQPVIMPAQLMQAAGEPLYFDVQPTAADPDCISQTKKLAPFATAAGNATAAWQLSDLPGDPSTGRMDIRPSSLMTRGRWLLGLYGPQNIGAGTEAGSRPAADAQDQIFHSLTAFLDDFRERNFQRGRPASQAVGSDLALISSADAGSTAFSEENVLIGKFRQPPPQNDLLRLDEEGSRRLSAFRSGPGNAGGEVSFRSVGQTIRHYSQLFGEFSGQKPPVAIYVGAARPAADSCLEWKKMTAEVTRLSGRPRVFGVVFANAGAEQISRLLGGHGRGGDEALAPQTRGLTCDGDSGSSLLFVPFPDLVSHPPQSVLGPAFDVIERWAGRIQN